MKKEQVKQKGNKLSPKRNKLNKKGQVKFLNR